jgi:polysaccharide pyruvyl transferase CsaB
MKVLVFGYFGFGNEGDELILSALVAALAKTSAQVTVLSADPPSTAVRHGVRAVRRWDPLVLWRELRRCDALLAGGGGLVQDLSGPFSPAYYLGLAAAARRLGKRVVWLGQGFGPVSRPWNLRLCRRVLPVMDLIVARDAAGWDWCSGLGVPDERLVQGADLAWLLPVPAAGGGNDWGVCLRADWSGPGLPLWLNDLVQAARDRERRLRFVALGGRADSALLERLRAGARCRECDFVTAGAARPDQLFAGTEWVISQRYHGLVLGAQAGAAVAGFGRDDKLRNLLVELGQPELDPHDLPATLPPVLKSLRTLRAAARANTARLRERAAAGLAAAWRVLGLTK